MNQHIDPSILHAALSGLETKKQELEFHIAQVKALLGRRGPGRPPAVASIASSESEGRTFKRSPAARRRMAAAQRRRYKELRRRAETATTKHVAAPVQPKKRKMSAEGLANIRAGVKKRLAAAKKAAKKASAPAKKSAPAAKVAGKKAVKKTAPKAASSVESVQAAADGAATAAFL